MNDKREKGIAGPWAFPLLLTGEGVSSLGSTLSGFAISVYAFQQTGAVTAYAMISFFAVLPSLLLSPYAGTVVDRWSRKRLIVLGNLVSALLTLAVVVLSLVQRLQVWQLGVLTVLLSMVSVFHLLAFEAATPLLVKRQHLAKANGWSQTTMAAAQILGPATAGALMAQLKFQGILTIDALSFLFAMFASLAVQIAEPASSAVTPLEAQGGSQALFAFRYVKARPGLWGTMVLQAAINFAMGMAVTLLLPLVLALGDTATYGAVMSAAGLGMLAGGFVIGIWGGARRHMHTLLLGGVLMGLALLEGGVVRSAIGVGVGAFVVGLSVPVVNSAAQVIWQVKVPVELQGRVFAARRVAIGVTLPLAYLLAGPLADALFEPALQPDGALASSLGVLFGVGAGRGVALLFFLMGVLTLGATLWALLNPRVYRVEDDLPDALSAGSGV